MHKKGRHNSGFQHPQTKEMWLTNIWQQTIMKGGNLPRAINNMEVLMDFKLTKAQQLQRELFRKFAETEIAPLAKEMDETEVYSQELVAKMQKYGFFGIPYSKEYGGAGADVLSVYR